MMAKAVQQSAERHARLFAEIMVLINTASAKRQIDPTKLAVIMQGNFQQINSVSLNCMCGSTSD